MLIGSSLTVMLGMTVLLLSAAAGAIMQTTSGQDGFSTEMLFIFSMRWMCEMFGGSTMAIHYARWTSICKGSSHVVEKISKSITCLDVFSFSYLDGTPAFHQLVHQLPNIIVRRPTLLHRAPRRHAISFTLFRIPSLSALFAIVDGNWPTPTWPWSWPPWPQGQFEGP